MSLLGVGIPGTRSFLGVGYPGDTVWGWVSQGGIIASRSGGSKGGPRDGRPLSCSFRSKNRLVHPLWELAPPRKILDPPLVGYYPPTPAREWRPLRRSVRILLECFLVDDEITFVYCRRRTSVQILWKNLAIV